ncbi:MAG: hypothetical protein LBS46_03440 [Dysgonamonadaceae bacterium]|jgi:hypothetical protein|nr:hypothetical protein [Dysgonamonadaceae bacterium]
MNTKNILSWLLLLFGEAIIIAAFILFRGNTPDNILLLNLVVSSLVYGLFFCNFRTPWIDLQDKHQKRVGAIGISWFAMWLYAIAAIGVMLATNFAYELSFALQLLIHCGLLFFLFLFVLLSRYSSDKVAAVYLDQTANRHGISEMQKAMLALTDQISDTADLPDRFVQKVYSLEESLRFISPTENAEAHELENSFVRTIDSIRFALQDYSLNAEQIENNLKKCERLYHNRKSIYSN